MTVRIWGNPRTISNLNCLFSMYNWKWVNLSKVTGFNISLSLNERQSSSDKKRNKGLRLVLFIPFRCCFAGSLPFSLSTVKQTKLFYSTSEMFFTLLARNTLWVNFSRWMCANECAASCNNRREFRRETHTPLWLLIGRIIFLTREKHRSRFWLDVSFFSRVKTIVRSSDWLELICVRKFATSLFGEYFSVCI